MRPVSEPKGNATQSVKPVPIPSNILAVDVPATPPSFADLAPVYREQAAGMWVDIWSAGHGFYQASTDAYVIERYVSMQVRRSKIMATLEVDGWTSVGSQGQEILHPLARLLGDLEGKLPALEDRLGLSPEARIRLGLAVAETKSKLDAFRDEE